MSESKHTPGPWRAFGPYDNGYLASGYLIVTGYDVHQPEPEVGMFDGAEPLHGAMTGFTEADAQLIAAAPDLLEFAREVVADLEAAEANDGIRPQYKAMLERGVAALAKATGSAVAHA